LVEDIRKLNNNNIKVELAVYLNDDPNDMTNYARMEDVAKAAAELNNTVRIEALDLDQEPSNTDKYENLIQMFELSNAQFPTTTTIKPKWTRERFADIKGNFNETN